ncbi:MAG TPA: DUF1844 domain-containing protein [Candidatus Brocadiia bacterium]|nr:DUF1844 domain-containing protein [Candidatus Brocadiia bacterium]
MTEDKPEAQQKETDTSRPAEDESWKDAVAREKEREAGGGRNDARRSPPPPPTFPTFVAGLSTQVLVYLGMLTHPATGKSGKDLFEAKYIIDLLGMLQDKTRGNLTPEEQKFLEETLFELRMLYVRESQTTSGPEDAEMVGPGEQT